MIFKKGDIVKVRRPVSGAVGIIQSVQTRREICGPDGDFFTERHYNVLVNGTTIRFHQGSLILVSRS
jgi:hypothetical protein